MITLNLTLRQRYRIVESEDPDRGPWKVSTVAYVYLLADMDGRELAAWHWHPGGPSSFTRPHLHVAGPLGSRCHLPTGRVSIEAIVRLLLEELNVTPKRDDWRQVLDEVEAVFARWRTWA